MRNISRLVFLALLLVANLLYAQRGRNGFTLHYDRPAQFFEEALVVGNGTLGGIIYSNTRCDRISLNDITLWTGEPDRCDFDSVASVEALRQIREALDMEDYALANELQMKLQGHYSENYQPLGQLLITHRPTNCKLHPVEGFDYPYDNYRRWLDISDATAGCSYHTVCDAKLSTDYFCSHPDQVLVVRMRCDRKWRHEIGFSCQLPHSVRVEGDELIVDGYAAYHSLPHYTYQDRMFWYDSARGIHFRTIVKVIGGEVRKSADDAISVMGEGEVLLLVANATSFNGFDKDPVLEGADYKNIVRRRMDSASRFSYGELLERHKRDYRLYFDRVKLDLGRTRRSVAKLPTDVQLRRYTDLEEVNPDLEELYFQFGRYLLISCSRTEGVPANLQGLWNERVLPPWSSNYTTNINLEENYWAAEVANLSEMHLPLLSFLRNLSCSGGVTARGLYGVEGGWCLAHNTDIWAMTNPVGLGSGDPSWACWNMGGAWLSTHIWEHFLFSRDTAFLRSYYPVLRGAAEFCLGWMVEKEGCLLTSPSTSPENQFRTPGGFAGATCYGGTADVAIIRECLMDASLAAGVLGVDEDFRGRAYDAQRRMIPYRVDGRGQLQEWFFDWEDVDPHHRHQSHLFGLFPGHSLDPMGVQFHQGIYPKELADACAATLRMKGDETTGWSTGWRVNLYARLGDGERAYATYRRLLRYISPDGYQGSDCVRGGGTYPNLLDAHSPYQIDGNFGGCAGVCEMLLQSNGCDLVVCPAVPERWKRVRVEGLRARTGEVVNFRYRKGKVRRLRVVGPFFISNELPKIKF